MRVLTGICLLFGCLCTGCDQPGGSEAEQLGKIEFAVTGKENAQPHFRKGLLLLHSFEFDDAAEAFQEAKRNDPDFVMAYWGEAMTHNHPLWRYQNREKADSVLQILAPTPEERIAKAATELEKDFMKGAHILYGCGTSDEEVAPKVERDSAYAAYLGELYQKHPDNDEVASFYGLALLGSVPVGRDIAVYEKAAGIAKAVLDRNPEHPGALHYLIHAYDDPDHANLALDVADAYAVVAPDAGHALHMPSHIYLAEGLWDKVISSNEDAWAAGEARVERKNLTYDDLNYHAFHWLQYGYLQKGRIEDARTMIPEMKMYCDSLPSDRARGHLIYLKTTYLAETGAFNDEIAALYIEDDDLNIVTRAMQDYTDALSAFHRNDPESMDSMITRMDAERLRDQEVATGGSARMCAGVSGNAANKLDLQQAEVMILELKAMRAWMDKDTLLAEKYFKQAVDLESSISYAYGPPTIIKPSWELYGEWLLEQGREEDALVQFEKTLAVHPGRRLSLVGKAKAGRI